MLYWNKIVQDHTYIRYIYTFSFSKYQTDHAFQPCLISLSSTLSLHALQLTTPPAKEGAELRASCYHAVTMPRQPLIPLIGQLRRPDVRTEFKSGSVFIRSVAAQFLEIWVWRKIERVVFSDTYSCRKDVHKCILHDRSPLNVFSPGFLRPV